MGEGEGTFHGGVRAGTQVPPKKGVPLCRWRRSTSRTLPLAVDVVPVAGRRGTCKTMCCDTNQNIGSACDLFNSSKLNSNSVTKIINHDYIIQLNKVMHFEDRDTHTQCTSKASHTSRQNKQLNSISY